MTHTLMVILFMLFSLDITESEMPSDVPTDMPSLMPTDVPSQGPSLMPTDVPSLVPTDVPSEVPTTSTAPSSMPTLTQRLLASTGDGGSALIEFNLDTNTYTVVKDPTIGYNDLAARPNSGILYGSDEDDVYEIDRLTLDPTLVCSGLGGDNLSSLEFVGNALYAARDTLDLIDLTTCTRTTIGATGATIFDIAYDQVNGILYGCNFDDFFTCDLVTGACTDIGDLPYRCAGLAFSPDFSTLYGSGFDGLFEIDLTNLADTTLLIGISPFAVANGLAFVS